MTEFKLGVNNCFAVKRWPEPKSWIEIVATKLEVKYVQFSFDLLDPRTKEPALTSMIIEIRDYAKDYGITIDSTFTGLAAYSFNLLMHPNPLMRYDALDWYISAIRVTKEMGVNSTGGHLAAMSWDYFLDETKRKYIVEVLLENIRLLSKVAKSYGLRSILWEPMPVVREPPYTINGAKDLLRRANEGAGVPIKLCIDLGHTCAWKYESERDLDPYAWLEELGVHSPVIHVQQTDGKADRHWPFIEEYNKIGIIKPERVLEALKKSGAEEVLLALEIIHPFEEREEKVLDDMIKSVRYWKEYV